MPLFKRNPFGHILLLKKWLIRIFGLVSHSRYRKFNSLHIEGSEILRKLPAFRCFVCFKSPNLFCRCCCHVSRVFNASLSGRDDTIKNIGYIWNPKLNMSIMLLLAKRCELVYCQKYLPIWDLFLSKELGEVKGKM